jgi:hypothetical protein
MRWAFSTVVPTASGLAISVALVVVSQSALVRTPWYQSALTVDTSFDSAMQALRRKILIDSFVVYPAAAIAAGGVVGLLSRHRARIAALIAALPVLVLAVAGAVGWVVPLVQVAAYGGLAWTVATFAHRWRHPEASQG